MNDPFRFGSIAYLIFCAALLLGLAMLSGCSRTLSAKIDAYGVHAITPYGIISMGVLSYERKAQPDEDE